MSGRKRSTGSRPSRPRAVAGTSRQAGASSRPTRWPSAPTPPRCTVSTTSSESSGARSGRGSATSGSRSTRPRGAAATRPGSRPPGRRRPPGPMGTRSRGTGAPRSTSLGGTAGGWRCTATSRCCPARPRAHTGAPPPSPLLESAMGGGRAPRSAPPPASGRPRLALLGDVDVLEHVDVDVAVDHVLARLVLLDSAHPRLLGRVAHHPGHRHVADVLLHDLLRLPVVVEALLGVAGVAARLELLVEGVVDPGLPLAGGLLAVEGVEVLVVRIRIVHEPPDPHELEILLPEPLAEHTLLEDFQVRLHVQGVEQHRLHRLGQGLGPEALLAHGQGDLRPVLAALVGGVLEGVERGLLVEPLDRLDPRVVDGPREAG